MRVAPTLAQRRKAAKAVNATALDTLHGVYAAMAHAGAGQAPLRPSQVSKYADLMVELSAPDLHVGKLAWKGETGMDYDIAIAGERYREAIESLVQRALAQPEDIAQFLLPVGNDLFHADNPRSETTSGTMVDTDTRYAKMFRAGVELTQWAIDRVESIAPVQVVIIPGNHDRLTTFHLGEVLSAWYRHRPRVTVDNRPLLRKYVEYGTVLLGLTHGSEEKITDLPGIMAHEAKAAWGRTAHREWHLGHLHRKRQMRYLSTESSGGVRITVIPSLSATDAWHAQQGYVMEPAGAEMYLWSATHGCVGHFEHTIHTERT